MGVDSPEALEKVGDPGGERNGFFPVDCCLAGCGSL